MDQQPQDTSGATPASIPDDVIRSIVRAQGPAVAGAVSQGIDGDADAAAHAMRVAPQVGMPAPLIANNYEEFMPQAKKLAAQGIVGNNPNLQAYVLSHPLAATVSNDDWAALDEWERKNSGSLFKGLADAIHRPLAGLDVIADETLNAISEGWSASGLPTGMEEQTARALDPAQNRAGLLGALASRMVYGAIDTALKVGGAAMQAPIGALKGGFMALGEEPTAAQRYAEGAIMGLGSEFVPHEPLQTVGPGARAETPMQGPMRPRADALSPENHALFMLKEFLNAGEDAPAGLHPLIDAQKAEMNSEFRDALEADLKLATSTATRERSPEMFREGLIAGKYGDHAISINSDAVLALYGDKIPEPEDGLLGWVPNIADQLKAARDTGQDITVPTADWLARVDPAVGKALRDDMRMWPGGVTAREALEIPPEARQVVQDPLPIWRASMSAEPKFGMGDRKLTLQLAKAAEEAKPEGVEAAGTPRGWGFAGGEDPAARGASSANKFDIMDGNGQAVGNLELSLSPDGKGLYVNWIGGQAGLWANSFGPALIRDLKRQIKELYPDREYIAGFRISGARDKAGRTGPAAVRLDQEAPLQVSLADDSPEAHAGMQQILSDAYEGERSASPPGFEDLRTAQSSWDGAPSTAPVPDWFHDVNATVQELADSLGMRAPELWTGRTDGRLGGMASNAGHLIIADHLTREQAVATGLHEFGHHVEFQAFTEAPDAVRDAVIAAWNGERKNVTVEQTRPITAQRYGEASKNAPASGYHNNFNEWFAEQVSRWLTQTGTAGTPEMDALYNAFKELQAKSKMPHVGIDELVAKSGLSVEKVHQLLLEGAKNGEVTLAPSDSPAYSAKAKGTALRVPGSSELMYTAGFKPREVGKAIGPVGVVEKFFAGIADVWRKIYEKVTGHIGLAPEVDSFMRGLWRDDAGQAQHPITQAIEAGNPIIEGIDNLQAAAVGLDKRVYERLQKAIRARARDDLQAHQARAMREQTKRQNAEWAKNRQELLGQVSDQIRRKPDIAADLFLGSGEYNGEKLRQRFTLAEDKLSPEQRAGLPEHYVSKNGLNPDDVAPLFGYSTGAEMVEAVAALQKLKVNEAGVPMRTSDWLRKLTQAETDRQMELKYGDKAANILDAAKDQALSQSSINVMYEELFAVANKLGTTVLGREVLQQAARDIVASTRVGDVNSFRAMQDMGRHGRNAEKAMIAGDWGQAAVHMQKQTLTAMVARELKDVEADLAKATKFAQRYGKRDQPSLPPEYTNWVHNIMQRTEWGGRKVPRTLEDIARQIAAESAQTLEKFVQSKSMALDPLHVWDGLLDPSYSSEWKALTIEDFRRIDDSLRNLVGIGKADRELIVRGEKIELEHAVQSMLGQVEELKPKSIEDQVQQFFPAQLVKGAYVRTLQVENILNALDGFSAHGPWTRNMFRELKEGDNHGEAWRKEFSKRLTALDDKVDLRQRIPNTIFMAPESYGGHALPMNRGNLRAVMLNWGTKSNRVKLAKGWKIEPEAVEAWINKHATEADWKFVRGVWDIFKELKERSDTMERSMGRMATKSVEPVPVRTPFGEFEGGYYPVIYHSEYAKIPKRESVEALMEPGFASLEPAAGFTEDRTGFVAPVALDLDQMPARLNQVIHRTAMLPGVTNFAKLLYEPRVRAAIKTKLGVQMFDMLDEYIKGVANKANYGSGGWHDAQIASEFLRQNVTTALVGFNILGTAVKHGSTAWMLSWKEAGNGYLANVGAVPSHYIVSAVRKLITTSDNSKQTRYDFAMEHSRELQRRDRNYLESLTGSTAELNVRPVAKLIGRDLGHGVEKFLGFRQRLMELASQPLAFSDKLSSVPTWLAVYDHAMDRGLTYGDAVYEADRAVRRAHGSTSITSRPVVMNTLGGWLTSFYNFFNDIFNRQVETLWRAGDAVKATKAGDYDRAMTQAKLVAAGVFAYSIWPALTEEWVSPQKSEPGEGWGKWAAKGLLYTESATMPVVRDLVNGLLHAKNPDVGMASTAFEHSAALGRDLMKEHPLAPQHAQVLIKDAAKFAGVLMGMPEALVKPGAYTYGVAHGLEHPKGPWSWLVGARFGTTKGHSQTLRERLGLDRRR